MQRATPLQAKYWKGIDITPEINDDMLTLRTSFVGVSLMQMPYSIQAGEVSAG